MTSYATLDSFERARVRGEVTMTRNLPRLALVAARRRGLAAVLVTARRGGVVHLVEQPWPTGDGLRVPLALQKGLRPVCGSRGRRWRATAAPELPLCTWCAAHVSQHLESIDYRELDTRDVITGLRLAETARDVTAANRAACESGLQFAPVPLKDGRVMGLLQLLHSRDWPRLVGRGRGSPPAPT